MVRRAASMTGQAGAPPTAIVGGRRVQPEAWVPLQAAALRTETVSSFEFVMKTEWVRWSTARPIGSRPTVTCGGLCEAQPEGWLASQVAPLITATVPSRLAPGSWVSATYMVLVAVSTATLAGATPAGTVPIALHPEVFAAWQVAASISERVLPSGTDWLSGVWPVFATYTVPVTGLTAMPLGPPPTVTVASGWCAHPCGWLPLQELPSITETVPGLAAWLVTKTVFVTGSTATASPNAPTATVAGF